MHPTRSHETRLHVETPLVSRTNALAAGDWHLDEIERLLKSGPLSELESQAIRAQANLVRDMAERLAVIPDEHRERLLAAAAFQWNLDLRERVIKMLREDCVTTFHQAHRAAANSGDWFRYVNLIRRPMQMRGLLATLWMARRSFQLATRLACHACQKIRLLNQSS